MVEVTPVPDSVELCRQELVTLGFRLEAVPGNEASYCFDLRGTNDFTAEPVERFAHLLWTELEAAQAAVRFARYFKSGPDPLNLERATTTLSLEETRQ